MVHNQHSSLGNMELPKYQNPENVDPTNKKAPPLDGGHYMKIGGMWNLKHETSLPTFFEIIIET